MKLRILPEATVDLEEAAVWYDSRVDSLGDVFTKAVERSLLAISHDPWRFARVEFVDAPEDIRRAIVIDFPYTVIFQVSNTEVLILAVSHTSRDPEFWLDRIPSEDS